MGDGDGEGDPKRLVARFYDEAINGRDASACERLLTPGFTHNGERRGRDAQVQAVQYFLDAFGELDHSIELILAEGELVAAHQRWRGTHTGEFLGVAATQRKVEFTSTAILRVEGELIAEAWDEVDLLSALQQLGAAPSP